jgi:uncharacterized iron-regulated membrane protein
MFATLLHHPRRLWMRRALFQMHLWAGVLLALYVAVIGLSGSILVFQNEIRLASLRHEPFNPAGIASPGAVVDHAHRRFPHSRLLYIQFPQKQSPWWTLDLLTAQGRPHLAYADAVTGAPLAPHRSLFIDRVLDLHVYLLAGRTGFMVNCLAGIGLLLLALTGALLWWPGIRLWKRALVIPLRRNWRRVNYDIHNAVGIWMLFIVSWWGFTAIYFLAPARVGAVVNAFLPLSGMKPPLAVAPAPSTAVLPLDTLLARIPAGERARLGGLSLPAKPGGKVTLYFDRGRPGDFSHRDILTLDGHTGRVLSVWHYGRNRTLGDWLLWLMEPLHFGTLWGLGIKILWCLFGLSLPILSGTGLLMYWNRWLRFRIRNERL